VGDTGTIVDSTNQFEFKILDTQNTPSGLTHVGQIVKGDPNTADLSGPVDALVDVQRRTEIICNHTATHLLHAALHHHVSESAFQAGSFVGAERLRFDFSFNRPLTDTEISQIEAHVNTNIRKEIPLSIHLDIPREEAEKMGAMAIFGEKYGATVRVVEIPQVSVELCGGCHVQNTRDIAYFRISSETGVAAGVRRIEAITNRAVFEEANGQRAQIRDLSVRLKTDVVDLNTRIEKLLTEHKRLQQRGEQLVQRLSVFDTIEIAGKSTTIEGVAVATSRVEVANRDELLHYMDTLRDRMGDKSIALLGAILDDKPALICTVSDDVFKSMGLKAGDLINDVAPLVGGKGGGRPTLAQAGGNKPEGLNKAIEAFTDCLRDRLSKG
jgi:alanyl-tRNA synthetase